MKQLTLIFLCILSVACYSQDQGSKTNLKSKEYVHQQCDSVMNCINQCYPLGPRHSSMRKDEYHILRNNIKSNADTIVFIEETFLNDEDGRILYFLYAYNSIDNHHLTLIDYSDFWEKKHKERVKITDESSGIYYILPKIIHEQYEQLQELSLQTDTGDDDLIRIFVILKDGNSYHLIKYLNIHNPDYLLFEKEMNELINR